MVKITDQKNGLSGIKQKIHARLNSAYLKAKSALRKSPPYSMGVNPLAISPPPVVTPMLPVSSLRDLTLDKLGRLTKFERMRLATNTGLSENDQRVLVEYRFPEGVNKGKLDHEIGWRVAKHSTFQNIQMDFALYGTIAEKWALAQNPKIFSKVATTLLEDGERHLHGVIWLRYLAENETVEKSVREAAHRYVLAQDLPREVKPFTLKIDGNDYSFQALVLAGGAGSRMNRNVHSDHPEDEKLKPEAKLGPGYTMFDAVLDAIPVEHPGVHIHHLANRSIRMVGKRGIALFNPDNNGTGGAFIPDTSEVRSFLNAAKSQGVEHLFVALGDVPGVSRKLYLDLAEHHVRSGAWMTLVTMKPMDGPQNYGRIVKDTKRRESTVISDRVVGILEKAVLDKISSGKARNPYYDDYGLTDENLAEINEVNSGFMVFNLKRLLEYQDKLLDMRRDLPEKGLVEYFLTDFVEIFVRAVPNRRKIVDSFVGDEHELVGVDDYNRLRQVVQTRSDHAMAMLAKDLSVNISELNRLIIGYGFNVDQAVHDRWLSSHAILKGDLTFAGENIRVGSGAVISDSELYDATVGRNAVLNACMVFGANISEGESFDRKLIYMDGSSRIVAEFDLARALEMVQTWEATLQRR